MTWRIVDNCLVNGRVTIDGCDARAWDVALQVEAGLPADWKKQLYRGELLPVERVELLARLDAAAADPAPAEPKRARTAAPSVQLELAL